ncbi:PREDICTED: DNA repair protein RAD51 homolog 4-like isoform X2 [Branchiostoma belcheri]|uniref:DNA repair protein RAD51 homolog 4-like isoform X1 n=1 Tax=Branchiostoma belcheri TaxID=7741 RepID=A0A6P4YB67_BRABE|nr:PREDICTED: DNA repair protein RAD51 homolog 4-like isoform X1 [Branchiostoma belcheri]XP_019616038.1 PREDICTED: DNA repair protein RAD51 homolog 4-like isoform X2 [Branchiostoma belcheri]
MAPLKVGLCPALTVEVLNSLLNAGVRTVSEFVCMDLELMMTKCGCVSYKDLVAIRKVLLVQYSAFPVGGSSWYEEILSTTAILSTGNSRLDDMLDGGIFTGALTELIGAPGSGKTQICMSLAVHAASRLEQNVLYVDTTGDCSGQRLQDILYYSTGDRESSTLSRIGFRRIFDPWQLLDLLQKTKAAISKQSDLFYSQLKLLIVDSVAAVISPTLGGQQTEGHAILLNISRQLKVLSSEHAIAVLMTNNVVQGELSEPWPGLGRSWQHIPDTRLLVQGTDSPEPQDRHISVMKSPRLPRGLSTTLRLSAAGILDLHTHTSHETQGQAGQSTWKT